MLGSCNSIFDMALYSLGKEVVEGIVVMKKIKYILCACLMMASMGMEAKSMKDLLVSMPDSVVPYLNHNLRLEFAELQEMGSEGRSEESFRRNECDGYADCRFRSVENE